MRGQTPIVIQVPTKGLVRNVPIQEAPPNSLIDGQNVYVDEDGLLKTRQGYSAVGPAIAAGDRVMGILGYRDESGDFEQVVGTLSTWQKYNGDGTFTEILSGLTGDADDPTRFTPFAQGGEVWVYGVNNQNGLYGWNSSLMTAIPIIGGVAVAVTSITDVAASPTAVVTLPANPIGIKIGDTVTIAGNTKTAYNGPQTVTGVGVNTFTFTGSGSVGLGTGGTASDANGGAPFTTARDITVLANRVLVVNTTEGGSSFTSRVRWSALNDGQTWPALAVNDMLDANDAIVGIVRTSRVSAIIYRDLSAWLISAYPGNDASAFTTERISVVDNMTGPCSPAAIVIAEGNHYYLGQDGRVYQYDGNTIAPISDTIDPVVRPLLNTAASDRTCATYLPNKRGVLFFFPAASDSDPTYAVFYSIRRQAFEPLMVFADAITAAAVVEESSGLTWNNWVPLTDTWNDIPFTSWYSIPQNNSLNCWIGGVSGLVSRFFASSSDNGTVIPYFAMWPPVRQDPLSTQRVSDVELYIVQTVDYEFASFVIDGMLQPYDPSGGFPIAAVALNLSDAATFSVPIEPGPLNPRNIQANYLLYRIQSQGNLAEMAFAGGTLFIDTDARDSNYGVS